MLWLSLKPSTQGQGHSNTLAWPSISQVQCSHPVLDVLMDSQIVLVFSCFWALAYAVPATSSFAL